MKKLLITTAIAAVCCSFNANSFEDETTGVYINLGVNHFLFEADRDLKDDNDLYLGLGYQINNNWGIEVERTNLWTKHEHVASSHDWPIDLWSINAIYRQFAKGEDSVFWKIGAGEYRGPDVLKNEKTARLGIGYDFALSNGFSWVVGADTTMTDTNKPDFIVYTGLSYFFGDTQNKSTPVTAPTPTVAPAPQSRDSDNDGVIDANDQCPSSVANAQVDSKGCQLMLSEDVSIKLNVEFANNSSIVTADYREEISKVATFMQKYPETNVTIEGHTDDRGAAEYNKHLSQKRASAVMAFLVKEFSIDQSRLSAKGYGEENPIADNNTAEGRSENRRVQAEIKTTVTKAKIK